MNSFGGTLTSNVIAMFQNLHLPQIGAESKVAYHNYCAYPNRKYGAWKVIKNRLTLKSQRQRKTLAIASTKVSDM